jgi:hypothetical protein
LRSDLRIRFRSLFRRAKVEEELDDELRFHLERQAEKYALPHGPILAARYADISCVMYWQVGGNGLTSLVELDTVVKVR